MPTVDERIESKLAEVIATALPDTRAEGRKTLLLRDGERTPIVLLACAYEREQPGDTSFARNVIYTCYVVLYAKSDKAKTGDEVINGFRQAVARLVYDFRPLLADVPEINDIRVAAVPALALPQTPPGVDMQALALTVETYETAEV